MKYQGFFLFLVALVALGGCGSSEKAINELSREQTQSKEQLRAEMAALSKGLQDLRSEVRNLSEWLRDINGDLVDLQGSVSDLHEQGKLAEAAATAADAGATGASAAGTGLESVNLVGADLETVAGELVRVREQMADLRKQYDADKELEALRDPRQAWDAMGNSEMLLARIDRFAEGYAATIQDPALHDQFLADVQGLRDQVKTRANMTPEQQVDTYRTRLTDLLNAETDERRRQWYQQQLETFNSDNQEVIAGQLDRALRMDNARAVGELAAKYQVSGDALRDNGLLGFGGGRGGFGAGGGPGRGGPRDGGPRPPGGG